MSVFVCVCVHLKQQLVIVAPLWLGTNPEHTWSHTNTSKAQTRTKTPLQHRSLYPYIVHLLHTTHTNFYFISQNSTHTQRGHQQRRTSIDDLLNPLIPLTTAACPPAQRLSTPAAASHGKNRRVWGEDKGGWVEFWVWSNSCHVGLASGAWGGRQRGAGARATGQKPTAIASNFESQ